MSDAEHREVLSLMDDIAPQLMVGRAEAGERRRGQITTARWLFNWAEFVSPDILALKLLSYYDHERPLSLVQGRARYDRVGEIVDEIKQWDFDQKTQYLLHTESNTSGSGESNPWDEYTTRDQATQVTPTGEHGNVTPVRTPPGEHGNVPPGEQVPQPVIGAPVLIDPGSAASTFGSGQMRRILQSTRVGEDRYDYAMTALLVPPSRGLVGGFKMHISW